jgi:NADH dehydrogenase FAD-containing subunit
MLNSSVKSISADAVEIEGEEGLEQHRNEAVIVCAGGLLPTPLLQKIGIQFDTKFGSE